MRSVVGKGQTSLGNITDGAKEFLDSLLASEASPPVLTAAMPRGDPSTDSSTEESSSSSTSKGPTKSSMDKMHERLEKSQDELIDLQRRVDTISLNENKRRKEREEVRHIWPPGKLVADERFYMIGFMSLLPEHDDELPVEVGVAEFTLNGGITRTLHRFIRPVYSRAFETKQTDSCLDWLARHAGK
ncbi:predicted protein [Nematostella vectensis]|uniref:Uncharacterized protein n=1 Tax=Nematostella vectensis TaxID=45351 RepID=A7T270_NEMVE|nr:predicted protein [Nematostella vectensis]|eukprot:XP_001622046.1 predicted protein [Nematostella vectensis]